MIEQALTYFESKNYKQAISLLEEAIPNKGLDASSYLLLSQCYIAIGGISKAVKMAEEAVKLDEKEPKLKAHLAQCQQKLLVLEDAFEQVKLGQHTSENIEIARANVEQLMDHKAFILAINELKRLTEARKLKTTNILWIGEYLKRIYFNPEAEDLRPLFSKLLLDEIVFYYLKACKLYENGYEIVRQAAKQQADKEEE